MRPRIPPAFRFAMRRAGAWLGIVLFLLLSPGVAGSAVSESPSQREKQQIEALQDLYTKTVGSPSVTIEVLPLPGGFYAVILDGTAKTAEDKSKIETDAHNINKDPKVTILSKLAVQVKPPSDPEEYSDIWTLTFISSHVTANAGSSGSSAGSATKDNVDAVVDALNQIYGTPATKDLPAKLAVQRAGSGRLLLRGTKENLTAIKRFLALIDAPWPQVQMNLWAVQVSGEAKDVALKVAAIGRRSRRARDRMGALQRKLAFIVGQEGRDKLQEAQEKFRTAGIDLNFEGPLSLNESLILLTLHPERQKKIDELAQSIRDQFSGHMEADLDEDCPKAPEGASYSHWKLQTDCRDERRRAIAKLAPFHRLRDALPLDSLEPDKVAFRELGEALSCFKDDDSRKPQHADAPRWLARTGATVDRVLKSVMDAFAADMEEIYLAPLLEDLQRDLPERNAGTALVGRTRIVVTSGLEAGLSPELASYVETTRPKPFGKDLLDLAFPAGKSADKGALTGTSRVLASVPEAQATLLAAVLLSETEPTFAKVAPGIAIDVRPTVLPDGGSARLTIDARFGVNSTPLSTEARTDVWAQAPPDGITTHNVRTDAVVSAFDLFDLSSFSMTTSHPRTPLYVPILGRLPIVGPAFQFPRHNKESHFESIILVNTVILPRSLELHRFYGQNLSETKTCQPSAPANGKKSAAGI